MAKLDAELMERVRQSADSLGGLEEIEKRISELVEPLREEEARLEQIKEDARSLIALVDQQQRRVRSMLAVAGRTTPKRVRRSSHIAEQTVEGAFNLLQTKPGERWTIKRLAEEAGLSRKTAEIVLRELRRQERVRQVGWVATEGKGRGPTLYALMPQEQVSGGVPS